MADLSYQQLQMLTAGLTDLSTAGNDINQGIAAQMQGQFQANQYELNARLAHLADLQNTNQADAAVSQEETRTAQTVGAQRAAEGAQGVIANTGTAADVQEETKEIGSEDAMQIRNNAFLKSFGYQIQQLNDQTAAKMATLESKNTASNDFFGAGQSFLGAGIIAASEV